MSVLVAILIVAGAMAASVALLVALRRRAPAGGWFADSGRAASVFEVLGTSFAVLLAFVMFLAFESYNSARQMAGVEAVAVTELYRGATLFDDATQDVLQGQLVCYARAVIADEWPQMARSASSASVEGWVADVETTVASAATTGDDGGARLSQWLEQSAERRDGRRGRLAESVPFVPASLWLVLVAGGAVVVGYALAFSDPEELLGAQALMVGSLTAILVLGLLMVHFLDQPYEGPAAIEPHEMRRTLTLIATADGGSTPPCDGGGRATGS